MLNMQFEISQQFSIESARYLTKLPSSHPCSRMHGHSFRILLRIRGPLTPEGWVMDFNDVEKQARPILNLIDHRVLNEVPGLENPTSEILCSWLYQQLKPLIPGLFQVKTSETPSTECCFPTI